MEQAIKTIKVELTEALDMGDQSGDCIKTVLKVNGKEYDATINKSWANNKINVDIRGLDNDALDTFGVKLDTSIVAEAYKTAKFQRDKRREEALNSKRTMEYTKFESIATEAGLVMGRTLEAYIKSPWLEAEKKETYKNHDLTVSVRADGEWFKISTGYGKYEKKKTKKADKIKLIVEELMGYKKAGIDNEQAFEEGQNKEALEMRKKFGEDVTRGTYGARWGKKYTSHSCFEVKVGEDYYDSMVQFKKNTSSRRGEGVDTYTIHNIKGEFTQEELNKIVEIVRGSKVEVK